MNTDEYQLKLARLQVDLDGWATILELARLRSDLGMWLPRFRTWLERNVHHGEIYSLLNAEIDYRKDQ